jgi:predicted small integral membrane protein
LTDAKQKIKYSYVLTLLGVALMAISTLFGVVRAMFVREMVGSGGGFGNRRFGMNPFGLTNGLTILAVVIAIVGLAWLGLALRKSPKATTS